MMLKDAAEAFRLLGLESVPVAMKFSLERPSGIGRLDEKLFACGMPKKAREIGPFYMDKGGQACMAGSYVMGLGDVPDAYHSGAYGAALRICKTPKAMQRIYRSLPRIEKGNVSYVSVAPLDRAEFEPDVVIVSCTTTRKAYNVLRAYSYASGKTWRGESTPALGCAWAFSYPYLTGEVNIVIPSGGMFNNHAMQEDELIVAIPVEQLHGIAKSLKEMPMVLPHHAQGGEAIRSRIRRELGLD